MVVSHFVGVRKWTWIFFLSSKCSEVLSRLSDPKHKPFLPFLLRAAHTTLISEETAPELPRQHLEIALQETHRSKGILRCVYIRELMASFISVSTALPAPRPELCPYHWAETVPFQMFLKLLQIRNRKGKTHKRTSRMRLSVFFFPSEVGLHIFFSLQSLLWNMIFLKQ